MAKFMLVKFSLMAEITDADALREAALKKFDADDSTSDDYPGTADWHASEEGQEERRQVATQDVDALNQFVDPEGLRAARRCAWRQGRNPGLVRGQAGGHHAGRGARRLGEPRGDYMVARGPRRRTGPPAPRGDYLAARSEPTDWRQAPRDHDGIPVQHRDPPPSRPATLARVRSE
jgi:hypothetical protein